VTTHFFLGCCDLFFPSVGFLTDHVRHPLPFPTPLCSLSPTLHSSSLSLWATTPSPHDGASASPHETGFQWKSVSPTPSLRFFDSFSLEVSKGAVFRPSPSLVHQRGRCGRTREVAFCHCVLFFPLPSIAIAFVRSVLPTFSQTSFRLDILARSQSSPLDCTTSRRPASGLRSFLGEIFFFDT